MQPERPSIWLHDPNETASGKPGTLHVDNEGTPIADSLVQRAAALIDEPRSYRSIFSGETSIERKPDETAFLASLEVDGWIVQSGMLVPTTPVAIQPVVSELRQLLSGPQFDTADRRLTQIESALDSGHWEQANASMRTFLAETFVGIAQRREGPTAVRREETAARIFLQADKFFKPSLLSCTEK